MSHLQKRAVVICQIINMFDGFDVMAIAFAAPSLAIAWQVSPTSLGVLFSAGLVGMTIGSFALAPLADHWGRRRIILLSLAVICVGMLASAFARTVEEMATYRLITGLGIGAILASINTMAAEYANARYRKLSISLVQVGYPIGATLGGFFSIWLVSQFGWQAIFALGAIAAGVMLIAVQLYLPESLEYLLDKQPPDALNRVNDLAERMSCSPLDSLPPSRGKQVNAQSNLSAIFGKERRSQTFMIWAAYFLVMMTFYSVLSWLPQLTVTAGGTIDEGMLIGVLSSLGGIAGLLTYGLLSPSASNKKLVALYLCGSAAAIAVLTVLSNGATSVLTALLVMTTGFFLYGAIAVLYTTVPTLYPANTRNTGTGWAIGVGRLGAVCGPLLMGWMIKTGVSQQTTMLMLSIVIACSYPIARQLIERT